MGAIHNTRAIIDEGSIYNIPVFMDWTRRATQSIIRGELYT